MKRQLRGTVAFAVCGSFCTLGAAVAQAEQLVRQGAAAGDELCGLRPEHPLWPGG